MQTGIRGQSVYSVPAQYHSWEVTGDRTASSCSDHGEAWRYTYKQISRITSGGAKDHGENKRVMFWGKTRREAPSARGFRKGLLEEAAPKLGPGEHDNISRRGGVGWGGGKVQGPWREQAWPVRQPKRYQCPRAQGAQWSREVSSWDD